MLFTSLSLSSFLHGVIEYRKPALREEAGSLLRVGVALFEFETLDSLRLKFRPHSEVVENYGPRDGHVKRGNFICVLLYIDEVIADGYLIFVQS